MSSTTDEDTNRGSVRHVARSIAFSLRLAWGSARWLLIASIVLALGMALIPAGQVVAVGALTHSVEQGRSAIGVLLVLALLIGLGQVANQVSSFVSEALTRRVHHTVQSTMVTSIARLTPQTLSTAETNATLQAVRGSLHDVSWGALATLSALRGVVAAISVAVVVWRIDPIAGALVTGAMFPMLLVDAWAARVQDTHWTKLGELQRKVGYLQEQLVFQRTGTELATLGSSGQVVAMVDEQDQKVVTLWDRLLIRLLRGNLLGALVTAVLVAGALLAVVASSAGAAGVAAGVVGVLSGVSATTAAGLGLGILIADAPKYARFREFIDSVPVGEAQQVLPHVESLEARGLSVTYPGADAPALVDASLVARRGELVALVGVNGAGKTTMVNALLGIIDLDAGQVLLDGIDAATLTPAQRLSRFGLLTQEFGRYELTVRQALLLGTPEDPASVTDERLWAALRAARIDDVVQKMPNGLDSQLGQQWEGTGLSGGQWQRLALARIHLRAAGVWVLDEPTSAIDAEAEIQIFDELHRGKQDRITLVVSHRAWTLRRMDRIHVFEAGRIVESGTYDDLLAARGRFAEIFAEQAG